MHVKAAKNKLNNLISAIEKDANIEQASKLAGYFTAYNMEQIIKIFDKQKVVKQEIFRMSIKNKLNSLLNEEVKNSEELNKFMKKIEDGYKKIFLKSGIHVTNKQALGSSISIGLTLGKDKSEYASGIIQNDPFFQHIWIKPDTNGELPEKMTVTNQGGTMYVKSKNPYLAFDRIKFGWRKKSGTPDVILKHID